ncbi:MAG: redoxin family protein [Alphaproteobacteria bacterium]|nr:redoxin family protein [Alphaproteobacteria bacterium]
MMGASIQTWLSLLEGVALILSPCILPVLPLVLAGGALEGRKRPYGIIAGFVASFSVLALLSRHIFSLIEMDQDVFQRNVYVLLLVFGVIMIVPWLEEKFSAMTQGLANMAQRVKTGEGFLGGMTMGVLIGAIWVPCAGPILAAALLQVAQSDTTAEAVLSVIFFSVGAGLPMLAILLVGRPLVQKIAGKTGVIKRGMGVVLIVFATLALAGVDIGAVEARDSGVSKIAAAPVLMNALDKPYRAPNITGILRWINSPPLNISDMKGKVVLVDFWTYSCINCIRTLPYLRDWYSKYHDRGFEIVGVHAPEFAFERKIENVKKAVHKYALAWPVAMDNDFMTWKNFDNKYWPAHYLINKDGDVVYTHFGEGQYDVTEHNIRVLLGLYDPGVPLEITETGDIVSIEQTPETYLGRARGQMWKGEGTQPLHTWTMEGSWIRTRELIQSGAAGDKITLRFAARKVFLVMAPAGDTPVRVEISVDTPEGKTSHPLVVDESRLYTLVDLDGVAEGTVTITAASPALRAYAFTFEGGGDEAVKNP